MAWKILNICNHMQTLVGSCVSHLPSSEFYTFPNLSPDVFLAVCLPFWWSCLSGILYLTYHTLHLSELKSNYHLSFHFSKHVSLPESLSHFSSVLTLLVSLASLTDRALNDPVSSAWSFTYPGNRVGPRAQPYNRVHSCCQVIWVSDMTYMPHGQQLLDIITWKIVK